MVNDRAAAKDGRPCEAGWRSPETGVSGTLGNNGWYTSDVTVTWDVADGESSISSSSACGSTTISSDTAGTTLTCTATSAGGTSSQSVTIKRDATAPTISGSASPGANGNGWNNGDVDVSFACGDDMSGVASCGPDQTLSDEGAGQSATGNAADNAGNSAAATVSAINIDTTAPTTSVTGVSNGATYTLGSVPAPGCDTTDALSGVATAASLSVSGGPLGSVTVTCSGAADSADNAGSSASATYSVVYAWTGFLQPVDNLPTVNKAKAGSAIPVKFKLSGDQGLAIFTSGYPISAQISCGSSATDAVEQTVTAGSSSLSYDATSGQYIYVWKTSTAWAGTCRTLVLKLADGTSHTANFSFTK